MTERFFMELNSRRNDAPLSRSDSLSIINGMRYLKLGVRYKDRFIILIFCASS